MHKTFSYLLFLVQYGIRNRGNKYGVNSFQNVGDYISLQFPMLRNSKQRLSPYYLLCSIIHLQMLVRYVTRCFPLLHLPSMCLCQILHAHFHHYLSPNFHLSLCVFWVPFSLKLSHSSHVSSMAFSVSFCRSKSVTNICEEIAPHSLPYRRLYIAQQFSTFQLCF